MAWNSISKQQAEQHQHYGLKGWLLAFFVLFILGIVASFATIFGGIGATEQELAFGMNVDTARNMMLIETLLSVPFIVLAIMKHKLMPMVTIACMWLAFAVNAYTEMALSAVSSTATIAVSAGIYALLSWYFMASKRVNVTYMHRLPSGAQPVAVPA